MHVNDESLTPNDGFTSQPESTNPYELDLVIFKTQRMGPVLLLCSWSHLFK